MEKKKAYGSPELEKLALEDGDLERVSGGAEGMDPGEAGHGDVGLGRSWLGGCEGVPVHRAARAYSSGRNSGC